MKTSRTNGQPDNDQRPKRDVPPEAAAIMAAMVRMPPKPHEEMKLGKPKRKRPAKATRKSDTSD